jgi:hypothetical protein
MVISQKDKKDQILNKIKQKFIMKNKKDIAGAMKASACCSHTKVNNTEGNGLS